MAWIESHDEIGDHPKTFILAADLGVRVAEAVGLLHLLWHFTLRFAWKDGDLKRFGETAIARSCKWEGNPSAFIKALRNAGFLDKYKVHDWLDFSGRLVMDRLRYAKANADRKESVRNPSGTPPVPVANLTLPTVPNQPNQTTNNNAGVASLSETATAAEKELAAVGYPKPDPKADPEKALACAYREIRKMPKSGWAAWDEKILPDMRPAFHELIEICGSLQRAYECMSDKAADFENAKYKNWTIRGVVKNAHSWVENHPATHTEENYGPDDSEGISVSDADAERERAASRDRNKATAAQVLARVRSLPNIPAGTEDSHGAGAAGNGKDSSGVRENALEEKNPGQQSGEPGDAR